MIRITDSLAIDERHLSESFLRSSGPGGQNVNKVATAVELRFDVAASTLPDDVKSRLGKLAGRQLTREGVLVISAQEHRSQERNREAALARLISLIRRAAQRPRRRIATKPTRASSLRRLERKARHGETKKRRQSRPTLD
jgi:ribosome-associated protein